MTHREPAYAGEFLRTYKPRTNINTVINSVLTPQRAMFMPSAVITREVQFPDVSFYQGKINWAEMSKHTRAAIIRAGQNLWPDSEFETNYAEAKKYGLLVGVYWFYDDRVSPGEQAKLLISLLRNKVLELEVYIDWENSYGGRYKGLHNVVAMMQAVEAAGLRVKDVGMYTGYYWFRANSNAVTNASQYNYLKTKPLWEAWYADNPSVVLVPAPWSQIPEPKIKHWQWGTPVVEWGQQTRELDMNFYNGTVQEFDLQYGASGEPMAYKYKITPDNSVGSKIRKDHSTASVQIGALSYGKYGFGDVRWGDGTQEDWLQIVVYQNNQGGETVLSGWIASRNAGNKYATITEIPVVEPPPDPEPEQPVLTHTIDVFSDGSVMIDGNPVP